MTPYFNLPISKFEKVRPRLNHFKYKDVSFYIYVYLNPFKPLRSLYKLPNGEHIEFAFEPIYIGKGTNSHTDDKFRSGYRMNQHIAEYLKSNVGEEVVNGRTIHNEFKKRAFKDLESNMLKLGHSNVDYPRNWDEYKDNWIIVLNDYPTTQALEAAEKNYIKGIGTLRRGTGPLVNALLG